MSLFDDEYDYDQEEPSATCKMARWRLYDSRTDERHACIKIRRRDDQARTRKV